ncbi:MAG: dipeptide epimerase [Sphingomonas bacterium]|uniref:N-acetyl-D-Glu racemase DgcA n=1 Tax=Sphingomonas bacterium TaxID=1895847 RepID=UPI002629BF98|nr:N-acetyl-D-Glu racemase DgcA [Sphingomonas bacterium]MDB5695418.1 dipeptide epimerase [Sphingomonas bacterium]
MRDVETRIEHWPLAAPFRISRGIKTVAEVVTVELHVGGQVGRGECVPYPRYGDSAESVSRQIDEVREALAKGARGDLPGLLPPGPAMNAIDCALWDLEAKLSGRSVEQMLGKTVPPVLTALTVSLDTPDRMAAAAAAIREAALIKVKVNAEEPEACIGAVRRAAPGAALIVDPNESWDLDLLTRMQPILQELRVEFVEQPLPCEDDFGLEGFEPLVPICADESCHTAKDLDILRRRYGMVNIKLDKTGGLTGGLELLEAARARGFGVMVGCMVSTSLSIAPAMHIAARADYADLDGPLWLKEDRPGGVSLQDGRLTPATDLCWG